MDENPIHGFSGFVGAGFKPAPTTPETDHNQFEFLTES
jgi:hypothetical protein